MDWAGKDWAGKDWADAVAPVPSSLAAGARPIAVPAVPPTAVPGATGSSGRAGVSTVVITVIGGAAGSAGGMSLGVANARAISARPVRNCSRRRPSQ
jgi:hypothetical protein